MVSASLVYQPLEFHSVGRQTLSQEPEMDMPDITAHRVRTVITMLVRVDGPISDVLGGRKNLARSQAVEIRR